MAVDPEIRQQALSCLLLGFVGEEPPGWLRTRSASASAVSCSSGPTSVTAARWPVSPSG